MSKLESYLGLCRKSGQIVIGQDNLKKFSKKINLLVISNTASDNLIDLAKRLADKFNCKLIQPNLPLEQVSHIDGCKIVGLTLKSLADAILEHTNEYKVIKE